MLSRFFCGWNFVYLLIIKLIIMKDIFINLLKRYTDNDNLVNQLWVEIEDSYSREGRYYHNLIHIQEVFYHLVKIRTKIKDWDVMLFTLFYHDAVYDCLKSDNEESSAELAEKRMMELLVPKDKIELCKKQILTTKSHQLSKNEDINYFIDADIAILGQHWEKYLQYLKDVREEYSCYETIIYNIGRRRIMNKFMRMERIFKTDYFFNLYEKQARENIKMEINLLNIVR